MSEIRNLIDRSYESRTSESEVSLEERMRPIRRRMPDQQTPRVRHTLNVKPEQHHQPEQNAKPRTLTRDIPKITRKVENISPQFTCDRIDDDCELSSADSRLNADNVTNNTNNTNNTNATVNSIAVTTYSNEEIKQLLAGYILIPPALYSYIPIGAHIRYFRNETKPRGETFKLGGFVQNHYMSKRGGVKPGFMLETVPGSCVSCGHEPAYRLNNHVTYPIDHDEIAEIWKKYDAGAFIEIHLIHMSLAREKKRARELEHRVCQLETQLKAVLKAQLKT